MPDARVPTVVALGFDFGQRRIGVASGDSLTLGARPLRAVPCLSNTAVDWSAIDRCVREWDPAVFVVGVPYNMDGTPTALTEAAANGVMTYNAICDTHLNREGHRIVAQVLAEGLSKPAPVGKSPEVTAAGPAR